MNRKYLYSIAGYVVLVLVLALLPILLPGAYYLHILIAICMNIVLTSSLRMINLTGQISLAHGGLVTVGAYTLTLLVINAGLNSWLALLLAGLFASVISCLVGFPFTRLKGVYFAMVTIFLTQIIITIIQQWRSLTNGNQGIFGIPKPDLISIPGILTIDIITQRDFYYLLVVIMVISLLILYAIEHSRLGLTFKSIEQSDSLAASVGVYVTGYKVLAFSIGGFFPGIVGAFYSQYIGAIAPNSFGFIFTVYVLIYMIIGGRGKFIGPIIGVIVLTLIQEFARPLKQYMPFIYAGILMLTISFMPEGLVGLPKRIKDIYDNFTKTKMSMKKGSDA